jgi:hypothetical protein
MNKEDFDRQLKKLDVMYEKFNIASQEVYDIWRNCFKDADIKVFTQAVDEVIKNEEYAPNVATVNRYYKQLEEARRAMIEKARECYNRVINALGCEKNVDDYREYLEWLATVPTQERNEIAERFSYEAVNYANGCTASGTPKATFKELLEVAKGC